MQPGHACGQDACAQHPAQALSLIFKEQPQQAEIAVHLLEFRSNAKKEYKITNPCAHAPGGGEKRHGEGREADGTFNSGNKLI